MAGEKTNKRDDDSLNAATVAINDAQSRIATIEAALTNPDQLGQLVANAVKNSSPFQEELSKAMMKLLNDYDTRKELESIVKKMDRKWAWRGLKYAGGILVGTAAIIAAITGIILLFK